MILLNLLFENTTKYTKAVYDEFLAFHHKKYHLFYVAYTVTIVAFILFVLILQVKYHHFTLAILLCSVLTSFILWRFFHPICIISKEYKSDNIQKEKDYTFKFYSTYFTVEHKNEKNIITYYKLYHVFETPGFFYLYLTKNHAFLLDKHNFYPFPITEFSKFIKKKYHWWNKLRMW